MLSGVKNLLGEIRDNFRDEKRFDDDMGYEMVCSSSSRDRLSLCEDADLERGDERRRRGNLRRNQTDTHKSQSRSNSKRRCSGTLAEDFALGDFDGIVSDDEIEDRSSFSFYFKLMWFMVLLCGIGSVVCYPMIVRYVFSFRSYKPVPMYNYTNVLSKSLNFYQMQRSGPVRSVASVVKRANGTTSVTLVEDDNTLEELNDEAASSVYEFEQYGIEWRGDSAMNDSGIYGEDLSGGYYDAGDHVKFGLPQAFTVTTLAWGVVEFSEQYRKAGELKHALDTIRWGTDFLLKSHSREKVFYGLVGDPYKDHEYWGRPENMTMERPAYAVTSFRGGTELVCEAAAAMAASSLVFRDEDPLYAQILIEHARQLFDWGDEDQVTYVDSIPLVKEFYNSWTGYGDELGWAALWLFKATGEEKYMKYARRNYNRHDHAYDGWAFGWDNKRIGIQLLLATEEGDTGYKVAIEQTLNRWMPKKWKEEELTTEPSGDVDYTPKGLAWRDEWGVNRYAANMAFIALVYANYLDPDKMYWDFSYHTGERAAKYRHWARTQMDYLLGSSGRSYVVGVGKNSPQRPHHRAASCPNPPAVCNEETGLNRNGPNPHILYGALVGGPDKNDQYKDDRKDFKLNEVAIDYNSGFQSALAGFVDMME